MSANLSFQWICSRCAVARNIPVESVLGIRARLDHEKCPCCTSPGTGMEYVNVPQDANATQDANIANAT